MAVDTTVTQVGSNPTVQEKVREAALEQGSSKRVDKTRLDKTEDSQQDSVVFSDKAKQLQETEQILRFALKKLEQLDEIRRDKLADVRDRVDSGYYLSDEVDDEVANRVFSREEIRQVIQREQEVERWTQSVKQLDTEDSVEVDLEKIRAIREKIAAGEYDSPEILDKTAEKILEIIR